jgi:arginine/lysine/ornithine decarboxylase
VPAKMSLIKSYLHAKMTETMDKIIDRDQLQDSMINQILDDMDIKTMMAILYDNMSESYDKYSVDELIAEVEEYYPHLLEESEA